MDFACGVEMGLSVILGAWFLLGVGSFLKITLDSPIKGDKHLPLNRNGLPNVGGYIPLNLDELSHVCDNS